MTAAAADIRMVLLAVAEERAAGALNPHRLAAQGSPASILWLASRRAPPGIEAVPVLGVGGYCSRGVW
jgi:hypothetical protein